MQCSSRARHSRISPSCLTAQHPHAAKAITSPQIDSGAVTVLAQHMPIASEQPEHKLPPSLPRAAKLAANKQLWLSPTWRSACHQPHITPPSPVWLSSAIPPPGAGSRSIFLPIPIPTRQSLPHFQITHLQTGGWNFLDFSAQIVHTSILPPCHQRFSRPAPSRESKRPFLVPQAASQMASCVQGRGHMLRQ